MTTTFKLLMCFAAALMVIAPVANAEAVLISNESFSGYAAGNLTTQSYQGTGYASGGSWNQISGNNVTVGTSGRLTWPGMPTSGGKATTGGGSQSEIAAVLDTTDGGAFGSEGLVKAGSGKIGSDDIQGTLYYSFLAAKTTAETAVNYFAALSIWDGSTERLGIADNWTSSAYSTFGATGSTNLNGIGPPSAQAYVDVTTDTRLFVARIDFKANANDDLNIWLDPDVTLPEPEEGAVIKTQNDAVGNLAFDRIRLRTGNGVNDVWDFDEIKFGTTWASVTASVPEPSTLILATLGLLSLGMIRRRRLR